MLKPNGSKRLLPVLRSPEQRVRDWNEFHEHLSESLLRDQGGRCMDCGIPFCHTGIVLNGAASGCPLNNLIPEWNDLVFNGNWHEALRRLLQTNNFPEFTGRVCPAPCEGSCVRALEDLPVAIKSIECAIADRGFENGWIVPQRPAVRTNRQVAVIGSGPAGLACADQLNKAGHCVTVFERADRPGGLLMYGIPNMKLDKALVQRRVDLMAAEGVQFVTNTEVGRQYPTDELLTKFDAVVLCGGATKPRDLAVENRNLGGIHFAMEFLHSNTQSLLDSNHNDGKYISAKDKDVIVIGGGDTGADCVATALRHGCRSLIQFEIMPQPPVTRALDNPWPQWPKVLRTEYAHEEAQTALGLDPREYCVMTERFIGDDQKNVKGLQSRQISWEGTGASSTRDVVPEGERFWPTQLVLLAMGFVGPQKEGLLAELDVRLTERGTVQVDENHMTSVAGVFAAGDMERGQSLVVWAIADGRKTAAAVDRYLTISKKRPETRSRSATTELDSADSLAYAHASGS
jgi:glutamate synthase (NADPH) small chain